MLAAPRVKPRTRTLTVSGSPRGLGRESRIVDLGRQSLEVLSQGDEFVVRHPQLASQNLSNLDNGLPKVQSLFCDVNPNAAFILNVANTTDEPTDLQAL